MGCKPVADPDNFEGTSGRVRIKSLAIWNPQCSGPSPAWVKPPKGTEFLQNETYKFEWFST